MTTPFSSFIKKKFLGKNKNLVHLNDPYKVMPQLLRGHKVTGIIDAGASTGRISKRLLRKFPKAHVYAFEPNPVFIKALQDYAEQDHRVHPQLVALSDHEGSAEFYFTKSPASTSLFVPGRRMKETHPVGSTVINTKKVELVTIDEWAKRNGDPPIHLMKFDIQASELLALRGAIQVLRSSTLLVYTEVWFNTMYSGGALFSELDLFFRQHGFLLYDMYKLRYDTKELIVSGCAIFVNAQKVGM
ncbi:MAG: FkbM family methyltransferase [Planctomycetota bacterium]|jgi:FkbM family methyltransferase